MRKRLWRGTGYLLLMFAAGRAPGATLGVSPSGFIIHGLEPGRPCDVFKESAMPLTINNGDDTTHTYVLSTHRPSERGNWEKGYLEIPDPRWCRFEPVEVTVGPNSKGHAHLLVNIPAGQKYYNQRWVVTCGIEGKPGPGGIALAVDVRAQLETKPLADVRERPDGAFGIAPNLVRLTGLAVGRQRQGTFVIYNNEATTHTYMIRPLLADQTIRAASYQTQSYRPLPDRRWLNVDKERLVIGPGGEGRLNTTLGVPPGQYENPHWEEILLVQPDQGRAGLIRIQVVPD